MTRLPTNRAPGEVLGHPRGAFISGRALIAGRRAPPLLMTCAGDADRHVADDLLGAGRTAASRIAPLGRSASSAGLAPRLDDLYYALPLSCVRSLLPAEAVAPHARGARRLPKILDADMRAIMEATIVATPLARLTPASNEHH